MKDGSTIIRQRQLAIRREMDRRGISLKQVGFDSGIPYATLLSYFPAEGSRDPAVMPTSALFCLAGSVPDDLLSLFLPDGRVIVAVPEGLDFDEIEKAARDFLTAKGEAHGMESPEKRDIASCEADKLSKKAVRLHVVSGSEAA